MIKERNIKEGRNQYERIKREEIEFLIKDEDGTYQNTKGETQQSF